MTATRTAETEALAARAGEMLKRAWSLTWPEDSRGVIGETLLDLTAALKRYRDLRAGDVPAFWPGLPMGPEAAARAFKDAAEGADEIAEMLVILLPGCAETGETS